MKRRLTNILKEENEEKNILSALRDFARGKIDKWELTYSDPMISNIVTNHPRGNSLVYFNIDKEYLSNLLDLGDENRYTMESISSNNEELVDSYALYDDFREGYGPFWYHLDEDNLKLLKKIGDYLLPGQKFSTETEYLLKFHKLLGEYFSSDVNSIIYTFQSYEDDAVRETAKEEIKKDFEHMLYGTGFFVDKDYDLYSTVAQLFLHMRETNYSGDLSGFIENQLKDKGSRYYWYDLRYNSDDEHFDKDGYNRDIYSELSAIEDEILENPNLQETLDMAERITKIIPMNKPVPIPKQPSATVEVLAFENGKVNVNIVSPNFGAKFKKLSEENFYNLLYQLELFDLDA